MSTENFSIHTAAAAGIRRPSTFLCLAPIHSASFPKGPNSPTVAPTAIAEPVEEAPLHVCNHCGSKLPPPSPEMKPSAPLVRADSVGSLNAPNKKRFLKLGPVFWGGNAGDDDYAVALED
ncbi:hypothetical protein EDC01DRAFT_661869 [Geopyxis carbonaria]|nr:hypothetical protein EDC01DRAFT_661869 [Geopyxis carbonaria]